MMSSFLVGRDLDEMAKIAENGGRPTFGENLRSVFRATYVYVMNFSLGYKVGVPDSNDEEGPWMITYAQGVWCRGANRKVIRQATS